MKHVLFIFCTSLLLFTCQKKNFDFEFVDSKCKNFKIDYGRVQNLVDPSCNEAPELSSGSLKITFDYNGDKDCIKGLVLSAEFFNTTSGSINNVTYSDALDASEVTIDEKNKTIEFTFNYSFANTTDANDMNYLVVKMEVEKPSGEKSNKIQVRHNSTCFVPHTSTYEDKGNININSSFETINLYDHAADDGDIVSVYVNSTLVVQNYRLTKTPQPFNITVNNGDRIIIYAMNQGSSGPNTVGFTINGTDTQINLETNKGYAYTLF